MTYLLDTNAWIVWLRQTSPKLVARVKAESPSNVFLCPVVVAELVYGAERSGSVNRASNLAQIAQLQAQFPSCPFDDFAAAEAGRVRAALAAVGTPIGPHDVLIAGIALAHGLTLVTHNTREFGRVPGLALDDWQ